MGGNADPDVKDVDGWTPLHHACFNGNSAVVKQLLLGGASLYIQGYGGFSPYLVSRLPQRAKELSESTVEPRMGVSTHIGHRNTNRALMYYRCRMSCYIKIYMYIIVNYKSRDVFFIVFFCLLFRKAAEFPA